MDIMERLKQLKEGDHIAFPYEYFHGQAGSTHADARIEVAPITAVYDDYVLVHFLSGYKSVGEDIKFEHIVAIGNPKGEAQIKGWTGSFDVLRPENEVLKRNLKTNEHGS